jgi:hypothetical protein
VLRIQQVYGGLNELERFRIPDPDNLEARLLTSMLDANNVTRPHVSTNAREQRACSADASSGDLLTEILSSPVSAVYGHDKAFIFSTRLTALFHTVQRSLLRNSRVADVAQIVMPKLGNGLARVLCFSANPALRLLEFGCE